MSDGKRLQILRQPHSCPFLPVVNKSHNRFTWLGQGCIQGQLGAHKPALYANGSCIFDPERLGRREPILGTLVNHFWLILHLGWFATVQASIEICPIMRFSPRFPSLQGGNFSSHFKYLKVHERCLSTSRLGLPERDECGKQSQEWILQTGESMFQKVSSGLSQTNASGAQQVMFPHLPSGGL